MFGTRWSKVRIMSTRQVQQSYIGCGTFLFKKQTIFNACVINFMFGTRWSQVRILSPRHVPQSYIGCGTFLFEKQTIFNACVINFMFGTRWAKVRIMSTRQVQQSYIDCGTFYLKNKQSSTLASSTLWAEWRKSMIKPLQSLDIHTFAKTTNKIKIRYKNRESRFLYL